MRDYTGDMEVFEKPLRDAGVTKEEFDICNYSGLTFRELTWLTKDAIARHKAKEAAGND